MPVIQRTEAKSPAFSDFDGGDFALPRLTLMGLPVHAKHSSRFMEIEERFKGWYRGA